MCPPIGHIILTRLFAIGVRKFVYRIIIASDLFSFKTSPLSHSHIFTSRTKASIRSKARVGSDGETWRIDWCRRHTGDVTCYAGLTVSLTEQCTHWTVSVLGPTLGVDLLLLWRCSVVRRYSSRVPRLFDYAGTMSAMHARRHTIRSYAVVVWVCCGIWCRMPPWVLAAPEVHWMGRLGLEWQQLTVIISADQNLTCSTTNIWYSICCRWSTGCRFCSSIRRCSSRSRKGITMAIRCLATQPAGFHRPPVDSSGCLSANVDQGNTAVLGVRGPTKTIRLTIWLYNYSVF